MRSTVGLAAAFVALVVVGLAALAPGAAGAGVGVSVAGSGLVSSEVAFTDPNGSALRYAIDGNFTAFVQTLPVNATTRAALLLVLETNPYVQLYSGNHDGTVEANEVGLFEQLIVAEAKLLPSATLTAGFTSTLDGAPPSSTTLVSLTLDNATGPDSSAAPITITAQASEQFAYSGTQHTLSFSLNATASLAGPVLPSLQVTVTTPAGTAITSTTGLANASTANDPLGWGSARTSGDYQPSTQSRATVQFSNAFPLGTVLAVAVPLGVAALVAGLLVRRRRRRRAVPPPEPTVPPHVDRPG